MTTPSLPELPEPMYPAVRLGLAPGELAYTGDQMRAYALSALAADRAATAPEPNFRVTFAAEYLTGYMQDEPEEARQKLRTLIDAALAPSVPPVGVGREAEHGSVDSVESTGTRPAAADHASPWIAVSERLPPKFTEVLIAFADCTLPATAQYTGNPNDTDGWCYPAENHGDGYDWTITHWMELPELPAKDQQ